MLGFLPFLDVRYISGTKYVRGKQTYIIGYNPKLGGGVLDVNAKINGATAKISNYLTIINNYTFHRNLILSQEIYAVFPFWMQHQELDVFIERKRIPRYIIQNKGVDVIFDNLLSLISHRISIKKAISGKLLRRDIPYAPPLLHNFYRTMLQ